MTKCIVLGQTQEEKKQRNPIEFTHWLDEDNLMNGINDDPLKPKKWLNIIRIKKGNGIDIMYAYDQNINFGRIYLGKWNDGFVEEGGSK